MARAQRKSTSRWQRDPEKEKFWRGKITGWLNSGLSIRAYCKRENISETCFYAWRREIKIRDRESGNSTAENAVTDLPDRVKDSRGRSTLKVSCDTDLSLLSTVVQILEDNNA